MKLCQRKSRWLWARAGSTGRAGGGTHMVQLCVVLKAANHQSGGQLDVYMHVAWGQPGVTAVGEKAAEGANVLEITQGDCISWKGKEAKKGTKPGKHM